MLFCTASVLYIAYWTNQIIYRLTLHPLARFPGPFFCRIGYLQQCYYEAILNGKFLEKLPEYHRKYGKLLPSYMPSDADCTCWTLVSSGKLGPVVRVNPNEVHISDPSVFHE